MVVSIVIATYARRGSVLSVTLDRLTKQTLPASDFEVIIVDDGSVDDGTRDLVQSLIPTVPFKMRYFANSFQGPGAAQNLGLREAEADLVLLLADDIHPTPTMVQKHVEYHQKHPEPNIAALGQVIESPDLPRTVFQSAWDPFRFWTLPGEMELPYWKFWACNISVKRKFLLEHGMYRERTGAAHEDVELGYRLGKKGMRVFYVPEALSHHYHPETLASACKRAYERGVNWWFIEEYVDDPAIHVYYHVLTRYTWKYYLEVFLRPDTSSALTMSYPVWASFMFKHVVRWCVFNRVTVPNIWLPFLRRAETNRVLARFVSGYVVRGAVFYHFGKGYVEHARRSGVLQQRGAGA